MARTPLMAGNWKMNLNHLEAIALVQKLAFSLTDKDFDAVEVAVLPPFTDIRSVQTLVDGDKYRIAYGAQDVSRARRRAPTPARSSAPMLAKLGCTYVVVGHSRAPRSTTTRTTRWSTPRSRRLVADELTPILCVGEALEVRQEGRQVAHTLGAARRRARRASRPTRRAAVVVAYEPVWAIGTGEVATPEDAQEVCAAIRTRLAELYSGDLADGVRILYGGSVKAATSPRSWPRPTSTAPWSAARASTPRSSWRICRYRDLAARRSR